MTLTKRPDELTILEVVSAIDPIRRIKTCPLGLETHGIRLCPLHRRLDNAMATVEAAFGRTTLAEILAEPTTSAPLCEVPRTLPVQEADKVPGAEKAPRSRKAVRNR